MSAVGHEIDVTLADLAADARAATPTEAAELLLPSTTELQRTLHHLRERLAKGLQGKFHRAQSMLQSLEKTRVLRRPLERIETLARRIDELDGRAIRAMANRIELAHRSLIQSAHRLDSLSPLAVLGRGYSISQTTKGEVIRTETDLAIGDAMVTRLAKGRIISRVEERITDAVVRRSVE